MAKRRTDNPPSPAVAEAVATIRRLLVNRTDRYGAYWLRDRSTPEERVSPYTAPWPRMLRDADRKGRARPFLGEWQLRDHVELAPFPDSPIGTHAISEDDTCKWVALDIDRHSDEIPLDATRAARDAITRFLLETLGLAPLVEDSGGGGWHIWVPLTGAAPASDAFALATVARAVGEEAWLKHDEVPRIDRYPTSPSRTTGSAGLGGGWVRLPGRHHKCDHESSIRLKSRSVSGLLIWRAFSKAAEINKPAKWRAGMRKARTIHAVQIRSRTRKKAKASAKGKTRIQATMNEDSFALDGWSLGRLVTVPLRPGERRLRELRVVRTAIREGLSVTDAGNAIRTLYTNAAGKSADLATPCSRAWLIDEVPDLVVRLAERADFRWATHEEAQGTRQLYLNRVANRERRGMEGWSLCSFTNWLGAFYSFLRTRAEDGGYAFLAKTMVTTSDAAKTGAYFLKQNGGARTGVALGRSPIKGAFGHYVRRNGKAVEKPNRVTGYKAWLHILATTPLDDQHRTGITVVRPAKRGENGLPVILDCSALPLDAPPA